MSNPNDQQTLIDFYRAHIADCERLLLAFADNPDMLASLRAEIAEKEAQIARLEAQAS